MFLFRISLFSLRFYRSSSLVECNPISPILVTWSQFAFREDFFLLHVFIYAKQNQSAYGIGKSRICLPNWLRHLSLRFLALQRYSLTFQQCLLLFFFVHLHISLAKLIKLGGFYISFFESVLSPWFIHLAIIIAELFEMASEFKK